MASFTFRPFISKLTLIKRFKRWGSIEMPGFRDPPLLTEGEGELLLLADVAELVMSFETVKG
jgi:hypothetical protein